MTSTISGSGAAKMPPIHDPKPVKNSLHRPLPDPPPMPTRCPPHGPGHPGVPPFPGGNHPHPVPGPFPVPTPPAKPTSPPKPTSLPPGSTGGKQTVNDLGNDYVKHYDGQKVVNNSIKDAQVGTKQLPPKVVVQGDPNIARLAEMAAELGAQLQTAMPTQASEIPTQILQSIEAAKQYAQMSMPIT